MELEARNRLAVKGIGGILIVDPTSDGLVDLYLPKETWRYLIDRFKGNKMTVCLRGRHDYFKGMTPPPEYVMNKLEKWIAEDGELDSIIDIITELTEDV